MMLDLEQRAEDGKEPAVKTIDRAARVLRVLSAGGQDGLALRDVATRCEFGKPTAHRLLAALIDAGFAFQDIETRRYRLGVALSMLACAANQQHIGALAQPAIRRIADVTSDTVYASVREGPAAVCVGREIGSFPIRTLTLEVGDRRPLGVGSGALALLAFLPDAEIDVTLQKNEAWIAEYPGYSIDYLKQAVTEARRYGFSFVDGRRIQGMNAIGMPVYDARGAVVAALSVAAITDRVSGERIAELAGILQREAAVLSKAIGATA
jgi:DNA-binding IclR family transcriptional regulator